MAKQLSRGGRPAEAEAIARCNHNARGAPPAGLESTGIIGPICSGERETPGRGPLGFGRTEVAAPALAIAAPS